VRALAFRASRLDLDLPLLESVLTSNERHLRRAIQILLDRPEERIGIFGLAFKENTDDLRESPVVTLVETLLGKGKELRVYDPHIRLDAIYGSNRRFIFSSIPHIERLMENDLNRLLRWASCLAITQKADGPARAAIEAGGIPVIDLTRISTGHAAAPVER
jgi:GDP-mannose 6-dehydrogenase